jgi:hypothetical protein
MQSEVEEALAIVKTKREDYKAQQAKEKAEKEYKWQRSLLAQIDTQMEKNVASSFITDCQNFLGHLTKNSQISRVEEDSSDTPFFVDEPIRLHPPLALRPTGTGSKRI